MSIISITLVIISMLFGVTAIIGVFYTIRSKVDTPVTKVSLVLAILCGLLSVVSLMRTDAPINEYNGNLYDAVQLIGGEVEENIAVSQTIEKSKDTLNKLGYLPAINTLYDAKNKYPNNQNLDTAIKEMTKFKPTLLVNLKWLKNTAEDSVNHQTYENVYLKDKFSNTYSSSFSLSGGSVKYAINKNYTTFSGTIACPYEVEYTSNADYAKVSVYGDGNYLWSSSPMYVDSKPQAFNVDITGIEILELHWEYAGYNIWENWGYYSTIMDGILQK